MKFVQETEFDLDYKSIFMGNTKNIISVSILIRWTIKMFIMTENPLKEITVPLRKSIGMKGSRGRKPLRERKWNNGQGV